MATKTCSVVYVITLLSHWMLLLWILPINVRYKVQECVHYKGAHYTAKSQAPPRQAEAKSEFAF